MSSSLYRVGILVVSDTASSLPSTDLTGPELKEELKRVGEHKWEVSEIKIVPDDVLHVQGSIMSWTDGPLQMNLIITAGGTGFAVRDFTPEVYLSR